jgi:hypothetical protein
MILSRKREPREPVLSPGSAFVATPAAGDHEDLITVAPANPTRFFLNPMSLDVMLTIAASKIRRRLSGSRAAR